MNLVKLRERLLNDVKARGMSNTVYDLIYRGVNRFTPLMVLKCVAIDAVDRSFLEWTGAYRCEFLDQERLLRLSENPEYQIDRDFLDEAIGKGDACFAILDADRLASYGWYSTSPTKVNKDLELQFGERRVYMYNGFTHPNYRGQRLHAIGMTMALNHYLNQGYKGLVSWVEANNVGSLRSCYRMGYRDFGEIYIIKLFRKYLILRSKGCKDYEFKVSAIR
ncbi:MAG: GNAT family N-acetyltransferase [Blastocatellia bacterium]|nr:GNAT family N-acetyltransferase [Blastocatellia bacterium]